MDFGSTWIAAVVGARVKAARCSGAERSAGPGPGQCAAAAAGHPPAVSGHHRIK